MCLQETLARIDGAAVVWLLGALLSWLLAEARCAVHGV
jgi:hypothetical protein